MDGGIQQHSHDCRVKYIRINWSFSFLSLNRFFLQEIQAGEALISSGDIEQGVTHLANAVVVCGQPTQLLQVRLITQR